MHVGRKGPKGQQAGHEPAGCPHSNPHCMKKRITNTLREVILHLPTHPECCSGWARTGPKRDKVLLQQGQLKFMEVSKELEHFLYEERLKELEALRREGLVRSVLC